MQSSHPYSIFLETSSCHKEKDRIHGTCSLQRTLSFHLYIILHTTAFGIIILVFFEVFYLTARDLIKAPACTFTPGSTLCTNHELHCLHSDPGISMTFRKHFSPPWLGWTLQSALKSKDWNSQSSIYFIYIYIYLEFGRFFLCQKHLAFLCSFIGTF